MMVRQYILTRFNLRLWRKNKYLQTVSDADWLEHRCRLFERYCLPGIVAQTQRDFRWIVLFDKETPAHVRERVARWRKACPQLSPVWVEPKDSWKYVRIFQRAIAYDQQLLREKGVQPARIATTYMDNDDTLARDYMERVAALAQKTEGRTFLTFHYGLQYFEELNLCVRLKDWRNHFQTLVEDADGGFYTTYGMGSHAEIYSLDRTQVQIWEELTEEAPAWVEVVHGKNVGNDLRFVATRLVTDREALRKLADIDVTTTAHPRLVYRTRFAARYVREFFRRSVQRVFRRQFWQYVCMRPAE